MSRVTPVLIISCLTPARMKEVAELLEIAPAMDLYTTTDPKATAKRMLVKLTESELRMVSRLVISPFDRSAEDMVLLLSNRC